MPWLLAFALGLALGFVLHRGDFCMATALQGVLDGRAGSAVYAYLLALTVDLLAVRGLTDAGVVTSAASSSLTAGAALGGLALGAGMVLARSCMLSVWSRAGTGSVGSLAAAAAMGASMVAAALTWPPSSTAITTALAVPTMWRELSSQTTVVVTLAAVIGVALWWSPPASTRTRRWSWPLTGTALGLIGALAWLVSAPGGVAWGLSLAPPRHAIETAGVAILTWPATIAAGIVTGAWVSADLRGGAAWRVPSGRELARRIAGGALMGTGAVLGAACSAGQALTGLSTLSLSAVVATAAILLGGKLAAALADPAGSRS